MSASSRALDLRAVDRRAGRPRDRRDGADVVEVAVGDEDRLDLDAQLLHGREQPLGLLAGIDDHRPPRLSVGVPARADDVGVLLYRADGERANVEPAHRDAALPSRRAFGLGRLRRSYIHWSV